MYKTFKVLSDIPENRPEPVYNVQTKNEESQASPLIKRVNVQD